MSVYNINSVNIKIGSSTIVGNNTEFKTYVSRGYLFKRTGDSTFYEVAAVNTATNLSLTSRYLDSGYYAKRADEALGTINSATKMYSGTLTFNPIIQSSLSINASIEVFSDNGGGTLTGDGTPAGSGTIDYDTGSWSVTLGTDLTASFDMLASYNSGANLNGVSYQIVTDYTPHKQFPEISTSDVNPTHIMTKALRLIDSAFMKQKVKIVSANYTVADTDRTIVASLSAADIKIALPNTSTNVGRVIEYVNISSYDMIATVYATPDRINDNISTLLTTRFENKKFLCATSNLWIVIP